MAELKLQGVQKEEKNLKIYASKENREAFTTPLRAVQL